MFQSILCPVDLSDYSKPQIRYARALAESQGAALGVLHVIPIAVGLFDPAAFAQIQNEWDQLAQKQVREFCGEGIRLHFTHGVIADEIASVAEREEYDLVVMPTHGYRGLKRFFLGSNFQSVLAKSPCPVCCLPPHFLDQGSREFQKPVAIACPVAIREGSESLVRTADILAQEFKASLTILPAPEVADEVMKEWNLAASAKIEPGDGLEDIHLYVEQKDIDLLICGMSSRSPHRAQMAFYRTISDLRVPAICVRL